MQIKSAADLRVGDIGFYSIAGRLGGWVSLGQALLRDECWLTHAYIVIDKPYSDHAVIVEAMPAGARRVALTGTERIGRGYGYVRLPLNRYQQGEVARLGPSLVGVPYSFADYAYLAARRLGLPRRLLRRYISTSKRMVCSQLVDHLLCRAGVHLFDDGRLPQDVTPGALFRRAGCRGEVTWWW